MDGPEWLTAYARRLDIAPPTDEEIERVLALAGVAAHASERIAAPVACWLAAKAGIDLETAQRLAGEVSGAAEVVDGG